MSRFRRRELMAAMRARRTITPASSNRLERLEQWHELSRTAEAFALYDADGRLLLWNEGYARVLGLPPGTLRHGMAWRELAVGPEIDRAPEAALFGLGHRIGDGEETHVWTAGGKWYRTRLKGFPSRRTAISHVDITELRAKEEELLALQDALRHARDQAQGASEAKSRFLANMSHELRTPLNSVIGFSELIVQDHARGRADATRHLYYARLILDSGQHLLGIVEDMLDLVRVEAGRIQLSESDSDLRELVRGAARIAFARSDEKRVELIETLPDTPTRARIDARLTRQAVINLLGNAIKFSSDGGRIWLSLSAGADEGAVIEVRDEGVGIPADKIAEVLEPFAQVETTEARRFGGVGLGLPLAKQFIELHGGRLTLVSDQGQGTTVRLIIPAARLRPPADTTARLG